MSIEEQLQEDWKNRPVETSDLDSLLKLIEECWKKAIESLAPASLTTQNRHPAYGPLVFAFGQTISLRAQAALYQAHIDNLSVMPKELANINCFSMIQAGLHDQHRSRGMYFEKLRTVLAIEDGVVDAIKHDVEDAVQAGKEAESLTKLFKEGLDRLWKQFYMPETLLEKGN